jgi:hypothetical protein
MTTTTTAGRQIVDEVSAWPGVSVTRDDHGTVRILLGRREIGHLHGDHAAHFGFPKLVWHELRRQERIVPHPVFPDRTGPAARAIESEADVRDVIELLRLNYDRGVARYGLPAAG